MKAVLELNNNESVQKGTYVLKTDLAAKYVEKAALQQQETELRNLRSSYTQLTEQKEDLARSLGSRNEEIRQLKAELAAVRRNTHSPATAKTDEGDDPPTQPGDDQVLPPKNRRSASRAIKQDGFTFELTECTRVGSQVQIGLTILNQVVDGNIGLFRDQTANQRSKAYDCKGSEHIPSEVWIGDRRSKHSYVNLHSVVGIKLEGGIILDGVPAGCGSLPKVELNLYGDNRRNFNLTFRDVSIRE